MRVVKVPGRQWVTCSAGWIVNAVFLILFGCFLLLLFLVVTIVSGPEPIPLLGGVSLGIFSLTLPWYINRTSVSISSTHLRRSPMNGRPVRIPLTEITHLWLANEHELTCPAGTLMHVGSHNLDFRQKSFDDFGPKVAELIGAEWLPAEPTSKDSTV